MKRATFLSLFCLLISICSTSTFAQYNLPKKPEKPPETAEEWYEYARWVSIYEADSKKDIDAVNKAIELKPFYVNAYHLRGVIKSQNSDYKGAIEDFNVVIQYEPRVTSTYMRRAEAKMRLNKDVDGALADYDLLIANLKANNSRIYNASLGRGILRYMKGDYDGAIADFTDAIKMNMDESGLFYRGITWLKNGNTEQAFEDLKSIIEVYKEVTEDARKKFPNQYKENLDYPNNQHPLASLNPQNSPPKKVVATIVPTSVIIEDAMTRRNLKFKSFKEKLLIDNWFDILDILHFNIVSNDDVSIVYFFYGQLLESKSDIESAEEAYTNAIIATNDNHAAYFSRGKLRLNAGKFEPAVRDFSWTISTDPTNTDVYLERGIALFLMGHDALAQKDFDVYLTLMPDKKADLDKRIAEAKKQREAAKKKQTSK